MKYIDALNLYNKGKSQYCHPRKGTPEHAAVLAIQRGGAAPAPAPKAKPPSATGVRMRSTRKTGSAVKMAVPKMDVSDPADPTGGGRGGIKMRNTRRKVKVAIPVASRPLPTTEFSRRAAPTTQFSSRGGLQLGTVANMPITQFSTRSGGAGTTNVMTIPTTDEPQPPSGVLGKEAGKMINMALKGALARRRLKEAEKQRTFDILLNQDKPKQPYKFKNVPKSDDIFGF